MVNVLKFAVVIFIFSAEIIDCSPRNRRYLFYNPGDLSSALGYQNHQVHDLTSLINEASANAHATGNTQSGSPQGPYNVPNFPAMGQNQVQLQTGSLGSSSGGSSAPVSGASGSGSASFAGTNQWRCDAHVVEQCDTQCMDVDPKDGCPFCIAGCSSPLTSGGSNSGQGSQSSGMSSGVSGQSGGASQSSGTLTGAGQSGGVAVNSGQSGALTQTGQSGYSGSSPFNVGVPNPGTGGLNQGPGTQTSGNTGTGSGQTGALTQNAGTLVGTSGQTSSGLGGNLIQQPSGLAGTGGASQGTGSSGKQGTLGPVITTAGTVSCPHYPSNCPRQFTTVDQNGCLVCTILHSSLTTHSPPSTTTQHSVAQTCAPKRCVAPCDKGIVLDAAGCPQCLCPAHV